jgi:predicted RNA-binding Zn ribbon-like protein
MTNRTRNLDTLDRVGNAPSLDFVNTVHSRYEVGAHDYLPSYGELLEWARDGDLITVQRQRSLKRAAVDEPRKAARALRRAQELRDLLYRLFLTVIRGKRPSPDDMTAFNRWVGEMSGCRRVEHTERGLAWGWETGEGALEEPLWPIVLSTIELLTTDDATRIKECPAPDGCGWLFLDKSKNSTRRWCNMRTCGNIAKARRHYHRHAGERRAGR